ncbi:ESPR-type extended signal peptide-containing protein, partial [Pelistega europaea]
MNKIYRVIFNKARGIFMAVSELTNSHSKEKSSVEGVSATGTVRRATLAPLFAATMMAVVGMPSVAWADDYPVTKNYKIVAAAGYLDCTGKYTVNLAGDGTGNGGNTGDDIKCISAQNAVAVGYDAWVNSQYGIAIGVAAQAKQEGGVALGYNALIDGANAVAIGKDAQAYAYQYTDNGTKYRTPTSAVVIGNSATTNQQQSIVLGAASKVITTHQDEASSVVVGYGSKAIGSQAMVFGSTSGAVKQSLAIGGDVYAAGNSSIAIGNDDVATNNDGTASDYRDVLPDETITKFYQKLWGGNAFLSQQDFSNKYRNGNAIYSPTYAAGLGSIAIGSRALAGGDVSTALGALSFALADRSTAVGIRAFVADTAKGATAVGENSYVFAPNSVAIGNKVEATQTGAFAYGYDSKAVGTGSLALGYGTGAAAQIDPAFYTAMNTTLKSLHNTPLVSDTTGDIDETADGAYKATVKTALAQLEAKLASNTLYSQDTSKAYLTTSNGTVYATTQNKDTNSASGKAENAIAMGRYAFALKNNSMAFGYLSIADGSSSIAFGAQSHATDESSNAVALGVNAYVNGRNSSALGYATAVLAQGATAVGMGSRVEATAKNAIAIGVGSRAEGENSIIFGNLAKTSASASNSAAIGRLASVTSANSMAVGNAAQASGIENSVALGVNSRTDYKVEYLNEPGWVATGAIAIPTSAATGVISVGAINQERRITNVASGYRDSDAVNVAQLKTLDERISNITGSENSSGLFQYLSVESKKGKAGEVANAVNKTKDYNEYVTLRKQYLGFLAREKYNGEQIDNDALGKIKARIDALNTQYGTFDGKTFETVSAKLDAIETALNGAVAEVNKTKYDETVTNLETAFNNDSSATTVASVLTTDEAAAKEKTENTNFKNDGAKGEDSLAFGWKATTGIRKSDNTISTASTDATKPNNVGDDGVGYHAVAMGYETQASGSRSVSIGSSGKGRNNADLSAPLVDRANSAEAEDSIAIGTANQVLGKSSIAIGVGHYISGNKSGAFGDPSFIDADSSFAIGNDNTITGTGVSNSFILGNSNKISVSNTLVLGNNVTASQANSVFLGNRSYYVAGVGDNAYSKGLGGDPYTSATIGGKTFNFFGGAAEGTAGGVAGVVSIASTSTAGVFQTRRLQGVSAGLIGEHSTDAINGSQLYSVITGLQSEISNAGVNWVNINSDADNTPTNPDNYDGSDERTGAIGTNSIAIGKNATANSASSVAIGSGSTADAVHSDGPWAIGNGSAAALVVQDTAKIAELQKAANDAATLYTTKNLEYDRMQDKTTPEAMALHDEIFGADGSGETSGLKYEATKAREAYRTAQTEYQKRSVFAVGSAGAERQIQHVAAGVISATSTDAINGSQLFATNTVLSKLVDKVGDGPINGVDGASGKDGQTIAGTPGTPGAAGAQGVPGDSGVGGKDGVDGTPGLVGPAGRDGLNGTPMDTKIQGLRDGVAGTVVYTDTSGNRVLVENGVYYNKDLVKDKVKADNGLWYDAANVNPDGSLKNPADASGSTLAELNTAAGGNKTLASDKVVLSAVNPDGKTVAPVSLGNLASALGITPASYASAPITKQAADNALGAPAGADPTTNPATGLFAMKGAELNRAATAADLQALAVAGVNFGADSGDVQNIVLGGQFNIKGDGAGASGTNKYIQTTTTDKGVKVSLTEDAKTKLDNAASTTDLAGKANVALDNITADGKGVITGLVDVVESTTKPSSALDITSATDANGKKTFTVALDDAQLKAITGTTNLATEYAKVDASNIGTNVDKWNQALGAITFGGDAGTATAQKLGTSLNIQGGAKTGLSTGNNIGVTASTNQLLIQLAQDLTNLKSATFSNDGAGAEPTTVINGSGVTITPESGHAVSLTTAGLDNGGNKITHVENGEANDDAATVGQVDSKITDAKTALTDLGFKFAGNNAGNQTLKLGEKLSVIGANNAENIKVTSSAGQLSLDLSEAVKTTLGKVDGAAALTDNTIALAGNTGETTAQALSTEKIKFNIQGADSGKDISANATEDTVTLTLKKAASITNTGDDVAKVVTSQQVYNAITGAKTTVKLATGEDSLVLTKAATTSDLDPNAYTLSLDKTKLKESLAGEFALLDASNLTEDADITAWKNKLGLTGIASADAGIVFKGWKDTTSGQTIKLNQTLNITDTYSQIEASTSTAGLNLSLSKAVRDALAKIPTGEETIAKGSQTFALKDTAGNKTDTQSFDKEDGLVFGVIGDNTTITTEKTTDSIKVSVKNGGISTTQLANGAVTSDKIGTGEVKTGNIADASVTEAKLESTLSGKINASYALLDNKIQLGADTGNTNEQPLNLESIKFNIKGDGDITTSASNTADLTLSLNKATGVFNSTHADANKVVKSVDVYNALVAAKPTIKAATVADSTNEPWAFTNPGDNLIKVKRTAGNGYNGDTWSLALTKADLKAALDSEYAAASLGDIKFVDDKYATKQVDHNETISGVTYNIYKATDGTLRYYNTSDEKYYKPTIAGLELVNTTDSAGAGYENSGSYERDKVTEKDPANPTFTAKSITKGLKFVGDGFITVEYAADSYTGSDVTDVPKLVIKTTDAVQNALNAIAAGTFSNTELHYKTNGDNPRSVMSQVGFDFRGEGSPTNPANQNIVVNDNATDGVIDFTLNPQLQNIQSIGSGSRAVTDDATEARLSFYNKGDATVTADGSDTSPIIKANSAKLTGLKDAVIKSGSTDAVTGGQLADLLGINSDQHNSFGDRITALENGAKGTVVYTKDDGTVLAKGADGKFYAPNDIKGLTYVVPNESGTGGAWYNTSEITRKADGTYDVTGATAATAPTAATTNPILSLVGTDGTTTPIKLANLMSALGINPIASAADTTKDEKVALNNKAISTEQAQTVIGNIDTVNNTKSGIYALTGATLTRAATLADLQALAVAGFDILGNQDGTVADNRIHKELGSTIKIEGKSGALYNSTGYEAANYFADNLITYNDDGTLRIEMLKKPLFEALKLQEAGSDKPVVTFTPGGTATAPTLTLDAGDGTTATPVQLKGIAKGSDNTDAVNMEQLKEVKNAIGMNGTDGVNGVDGAGGPAGKDGTNGQSILNKIQALRDGTAGPVVYTDKTGTRVISEDGTYYYPEGLVSDKKKANDGLWYESGFVAADGTLNENALATAGYTKNTEGKWVKDGAVLEGKTLAGLADAADKDALESTDVILSTVNANGKTTTPITLANLTGAFGITVTNPNKTVTEATASDAQTKVQDLLKGETSAANSKDGVKALDMSRVATAADLQVLARAGLVFSGNNSTTKVDRALSQELAITGYTTDAAAFTELANAAANNIFVEGAAGTDTTAGTLTLKLAKDLVNITSIGAGAAADTANAARISFTNGDATTKPQISMNNAKVTNVAPGTIGANSKDAVNGAQLESIRSILGGSDYKVDATTGLVSAPATKTADADGNEGGIGGTGQTTIDAAINELRTTAQSAAAGKLLFKTEATAGAATNVTIEKTLGQTLDVTTADATVNGTTYQGDNIIVVNDGGKLNIALNQAKDAATIKNTNTFGGDEGGLVTGKILKDYIAASAGFNYKAGADTAFKQTSHEKGFTFLSGNDNITATSAADGVITYTMADTLTGITSIEGSVTKDSGNTAAKITLKESSGANGTPSVTLNNAKIDGLAKGTANGDAVEFSQLSALASTLGATVGNDGTVTGPTFNTIVKGGSTEAPADTKDAIDDLITAVNKGIKFGANKGTAATKYLGDTLAIKAADVTNTATGATDIATQFLGKNLLTGIDKSTGGVLIGFSDKPEFSALTLKDTADTTKPAVTLTPGGTADAPTLTLGSGTNNATPVEIKGVAKGTGNDSAVNKAQLDELAAKIGVPINGTDGTDGINGVDGYNGTGERGIAGTDGSKGVPGKDGAAGVNGQKGPAGKDGLSGTTVVNKVQGLRDGIAGTVVYTEADGSRVLVENGTYYKADLVSGKEKANDGKWYDADDVDAYGNVAAGKESTGKTLAELSNASTLDNKGVVAPEKVILSAVDPNGKTATPVTLANLVGAFGVDIDSTNKQLANATATKTGAQAKVEKLLEAKNADGTILDMTRVATAADLYVLAQAGLDFVGNDDKTVHRALSQTLSIKGEGTPAADFASAENNIKVIQNTAKDGLTIQLADKLVNMTSIAGKTAADKPTAATITFGDPVATGGTPTISMNDARLTNVADGKDGKDAVNVNQLKAVADQIGVPVNAKDGINGVDGTNGTTKVEYADGKGVPGTNGKAGTNGQTGPAGKDGLNGTTLVNKVQGLRDGVAGTVVYTDKSGNRVLVENGNYYKPALVTGMEKANDGLWYAKDLVKADGSINEEALKAKEDAIDADTSLKPEQKAAAKAALKGKTLAALAGTDKTNVVEAKEVMLSAVNPNGDTNAPTTLANVKSALDLTGNATNTTASAGKDKAPDAIEADAAQKVIAGDSKDGKGGLLTKSGAVLNRVTTLGDLQALAQAGLDFKGSLQATDVAAAGTTIHRPVGTGISIIGAKDKTAGLGQVGDYDNGKNLATVVNKDTNEIQVVMKKQPTFEAVKLNDGKDGSTTTIIKTESDGDVVFGKDGKNGADGKVVISGIKDGDTDDSAVTKGALDDLKEKLGFKDGANGHAGNDGVDGGSVVDKVEALRDGTAGPVVYTNKDGDRVTKLGDTFYKLADVQALEKAGAEYRDGKWYEKGTDTVITANADGAGAAKALADLDANKPKANEIKLSLVSSSDNTKTATKLSNVANGDVSQKSTDAVNGSQLYSVQTGLQDQVNDLKQNSLSAVNLVGNKEADGKGKLQGSNNTLTVKGEGDGLSNADKTAANNIYVVADGNNNMTVKLAANLENLQSATFTTPDKDATDKSGFKVDADGVQFTKVDGTKDSSAPSITKDGIDAGDKKITNVAAGTISATSEDAINGSQLAKLIGDVAFNDDGTVKADDPNDADGDGNKGGIGGTGKTTINEAINEVRQTAGATTVKAGKNIKVTPDTEGAK